GRAEVRGGRGGGLPLVRGGDPAAAAGGALRRASHLSGPRAGGAARPGSLAPRIGDRGPAPAPAPQAGVGSGRPRGVTASSLTIPGFSGALDPCAGSSFSPCWFRPRRSPLRSI